MIDDGAADRDRTNCRGWGIVIVAVRVRFSKDWVRAMKMC